MLSIKWYNPTKISDFLGITTSIRGKIDLVSSRRFDGRRGGQQPGRLALRRAGAAGTRLCARNLRRFHPTEGS